MLMQKQSTVNEIDAPPPLPMYFKLAGEDDAADDMLTEDYIYPAIEQAKAVTTSPPIQQNPKRSEPKVERKKDGRGRNRNATKQSPKIQH
jgi:hypothetical protein